jgi:hypothetical protein
LSNTAYLPDVNLLVALSDPEHSAHSKVAAWHQSIGTASFLLCPITEAGFARLMATPAVGGESISTALLLLKQVTALPNVGHLTVAPNLLELIRPIESRLQGYRQVTDALLLGLAIKNNAILVTLDRGIESLTGPKFSGSLLVLR